MKANRIRIVVLALILSLGAGLSATVYVQGVRAPLGPTLSPLFQTVGQVPQSLDRLLTKVVHVDSLDEKEFGEAIRGRLNLLPIGGDFSRDEQYVAGFAKNLAAFSKKPFDYVIRLTPSSCPNAYAMPGGVIVVTQGLLNTLKSESQLFSVIAHEMGHIELDHCMQAVKFELAAKKLGAAPLGQIADLAIRLLAGHSFSKTQENDADEYSFDLLLQTDYDPAAPGQALGQLKDTTAERREKSLDPIRDYLRSHPPLPLRIDKFTHKSAEWWRKNDGRRRYVGTQNLKQRSRFGPENTFKDEWVTTNTKFAGAGDKVN